MTQKTKLKKAFELEHLVRSLKTAYIRKQTQVESENNGGPDNYGCTRNYNKYLQNLKQFYNNNQTFIDSNMLTTANTIHYVKLYLRFFELLNTQPTPIDI